jgi:hypothetical protein
MFQESILIKLFVFLSVLILPASGSLCSASEGVEASADGILNFVGVSRDCIDSVARVETNASQLDSLGWRGLLPVAVDDTSSLHWARTRVLIQGQWENSNPVYIIVHVLVHEVTGEPLLALAYDDLERASWIQPVSFDRTREMLEEHTHLRVSSRCSEPLHRFGGLVPTIGELSPGRTRIELATAALVVFHRIEVTVDNEPGCVWIITSYDLMETAAGGDRHEAYANKLEVLNGSPSGLPMGRDLNGVDLVKWDGFPGHPENIKVMENLEERFMQYQQQRQQWLNEREQKR